MPDSSAAEGHFEARLETALEAAPAALVIVDAFFAVLPRVTPVISAADVENVDGIE
jgi:hypothetical protein